MHQPELHALRVRRKKRSSLPLLALLAILLVLAAFGTYCYTASADELVSDPAPRPDTAAAVAHDPTETPSAEPGTAAAPTGTSILIRKSEFRLYLLVDGSVVDSWPIALGKNAGQKLVSGDMRTPDGTFPIDEVLDASYWTHDFHDGRGEIEGAYGPYFISLDTSELSGGAWDGIGIHGTHDPDSRGSMATEGCIRMSNEEVQELRRYAYRNMRVIIEE